MKRMLRIALVAELTPGYCEGVVRGIGMRARPALPWVFELLRASPDAVERVCREGIDGAIVVTLTPTIAGILNCAGVPYINCGPVAFAPGVPHVGNDDLAIGNLAATHFMERGFSHLAYVGMDAGGAGFVAGRREGFCARAAEAECPVALRDVAGPLEDLGQWLAASAKPLGVLAANDTVAWQVVEACRVAGLRVPEQVAVVGVDDDPALCHLAYPPLSSVVVAAQRIGAEAAAMLAQLLSRRTLARLRVLAPPVGVAVRQSSDIFAIEDEDVVKALRFIEAKASGPLSVADVASHVAIGRRTLEQRFRQRLGRTPYDEILRVRIERARQLLAATSLPLSEIARRCGFDEGKRLSTVFRRAMGATPSSLRGIRKGDNEGPGWLGTPALGRASGYIGRGQ